ncbi:isoleucine--tRNA ligase [Candidatus Cytomitobacter primus]|uniref:Isoleucine--tRNA ligase n=1 Tax=Candidatus Cytomitobacter primus TaxID=2066024 RepID=A0A5C0UFJ3_9PROT|nr:isoleucine--tRNA ligase [Candidatus Cytomitobacter primus]QEK38413.1 isoleucine--tRNA ligase [Candidatus Cytomitobacter primus]
MKYPVALPKTTFGIKSKDNQKTLDFWTEISLYSKLKDRNYKLEGRKLGEFLLHDGPPFANGAPHMGHAVNKIMKDIFNRGKAMLGYSINYVPGWDCHGLPIEAAVESELKKSGKRRSELNITEFRKLCFDFASKWVEVQKDGFIKMGVIGDFDNPYKTMNSQLDILKEFHKFVADGLVYRGSKPVMWSCSERTALAEAEVEYYDKKSNSIDVKFEIIKSNNSELNGCKIVIWTTTPWTLPANRAVAYGADFEYVIFSTNEQSDENTLKNDKNNEKLIVAKELYSDFCKRANLDNTKIIRTIVGSDLAGVFCKHPMYDFGFKIEVPVISGHHVILDQGTGLVHTAPSHGEEDFVIGKKYNLDVPELVDEKGKYKPNVPFVGGEDIFESENKIIEELKSRNIIAAHHKIVHSYPHSWRSRKPLIYRVTPQWFMNIAQMKKNALHAVENVNWIPEFGKNRFVSMLENRGDWCVSRQRVWGVPLAILYHNETGEVLKDQSVLDAIQNELGEKGVDAWWSVAEKYAKKYPDYVPVYDILDVWFESGASQAYVLNHKQADVYFEGSDQHRGWFQSSGLQASRNEVRLPYKNLITHGFVVDKQGRKMSKSLGNGVSPIDLIDEYGADLIRLWIASQNYTEDLRWSLEHLNRVKDMEKRFRNTLKYMIGSIQFGYEYDYDSMPLLEKWILHKLYVLNEEFKESINEFTTYKFMRKLFLFCTVDLSAFYLDIRKEILYCDDINESLPKAVRMVLKYTLDCLLRWLAPIMSFAAEEAWHAMSNTDSIHEQVILDLDSQWNNEELDSQVAELRNIRRVVTSALENMRESKEINSSLDAEIVIIAPESGQLFENIVSKVTNRNTMNGKSSEQMSYERVMQEICIVSGLKTFTNIEGFESYNLSLNGSGQFDISQIHEIDDVKNVKVIAKKADGNKCPRCKKVYKNIEELCVRCERVVKLHV